MQDFPSKEERIDLRKRLMSHKGRTIGLISKDTGLTYQRVSAAVQARPIPISAFQKIKSWLNDNKYEEPIHPIIRRWQAHLTTVQYDIVSRRVLAGLLLEYVSGNKEPLFEKFESLEDGEYFELCKIFRDTLVAVKINDEYLAWRLLR